MRLNGSVHRIADMYAPNVKAGLPDGRYVRAVAMPFEGGLICRLRSAWAVLKGDAYAVDWPEAGDLEKALKERI